MTIFYTNLNNNTRNAKHIENEKEAKRFIEKLENDSNISNIKIWK